MSDINKEALAVKRIIEDFDVEPTVDQMERFKALVKKYRARIESSEPWSKEKGWATINIGDFVSLVYDRAKGYQMKTLMNSNVYGFAEVKQWSDETDYALLLLIRIKEIRIPVCP